MEKSLHPPLHSLGKKQQQDTEYICAVSIVFKGQKLQPGAANQIQLIN